MSINYRKNELEQKMLMNLHKKDWTHGLRLADAPQHASENEATLKVESVSS
jgi:26S proteasome regulatory subunit N11